MLGLAASSCRQSVVLPAPEGAEMTIKSGVDGPAVIGARTRVRPGPARRARASVGPGPLRRGGFPGSFDVLRLLPELFQFGFQDDDFARNDAVIGLRPDGIDFAIH